MPRRTSAENVYFDVDDGSGPLRIFVSPRAGIATDGILLGSVVEITGVLGQETTGKLRTVVPAVAALLVRPPNDNRLPRSHRPRSRWQWERCTTGRCRRRIERRRRSPAGHSRGFFELINSRAFRAWRPRCRRRRSPRPSPSNLRLDGSRARCRTPTPAAAGLRGAAGAGGSAAGQRRRGRRTAGPGRASTGLPAPAPRWARGRRGGIYAPPVSGVPPPHLVPLTVVEDAHERAGRILPPT